MSKLKYIRFGLRKPLLLIKALKMFLLSRFSSKKVFRGVELAVTYQCQAKCDKCSCLNLVDNKKKEMDKNQILDICNKIVYMDGILVNLTGGEPLLRKDILEIIREINRLPLLVSISTNGLLLDGQFLKKLYDAGVDLIQLSLSSPIESEHDSHIGIPGSYKKVLKAISKAKKLGLEVFINTVMTKNILNTDRINRLENIAKETGSFLSLILPAAVGGWKSKEVNLNYNDYQIIKRLLRKKFVTIDTESCYRKGICPAGSEKIYISPYGDLYPCPFIHRHCGNVLEENLKDLWLNMPCCKDSGCINLKDGIN